MARIAGIDIPKNKRIVIALTYIFGIGKRRAEYIVTESKLNPNQKVYELSDDKVTLLRSIIEDNYEVEGDLRRFQAMNIKRLIDIGCYRGRRHRLNLPVRGQRTKTNARTRRGSRQTVAGKKKALKK
uniref:Ribosomal protein S13 n=1 Tax=Gloeochaete wittrockiana TaxID=38269 RepID=A0A3G1IW11_9EUKA|nr:ribosomal protein S13 [Gloeochaete wittrockiana]ASQ40235.1 ribosomal protein S13 [Gloeochaete wittrockiana]